MQDHGAKAAVNSIREIWSSKHTERFTARINEAADMLETMDISRALHFVDGELDRFEQITLSILRKDVECRS